jgi:hypothetical protein
VLGGLALAGLTFACSMAFLFQAEGQVFAALPEWFGELRKTGTAAWMVDTVLVDRAFQMIVVIRVMKALGGLSLSFLGFALLVVGIRQPATLDGTNPLGWQLRGAGLSPGLIALLAGTYLLATAPDGLEWRRGVAGGEAVSAGAAGEGATVDAAPPRVVPPSPPAAGLVGGTAE